MRDKRQKAKGRRSNQSFVATPHVVLEHENYARLTFRARSLLWDIYGQYRGKNNGDLCACLSIMRKRGWNSNDQLDKAKKELLETGWIIKTRHGGLNLGPDLFAVTFKPVNECGSKIEHRETRTAPGYWKLGYNPENKSASPPHGAVSTATRIRG